MGDGVRHKGALAGILFQELHPGGRVVEQVLHPDGGPHAAGTGFDGIGFPALDAVDRGTFVRFGPGQYLHPRHTGDGGQCFASEAEGVDMVQVLLGLDLAGGMADERRGDVGGFDAGAVVADLDQFDAAGLDAHRDLGGTGVDGVFEQFFDHRSRPLDDLTGGDQLCGVFVQNMDDCHRFPPLFVGIWSVSAVQAALQGLFELVQEVQCFNGGQRLHIEGFQLFQHFAGHGRRIVLL